MNKSDSIRLMAKAQSRRPAARNASGGGPDGRLAHGAQALAAAELLSFLRESGTHTWTERDLSKVLNISLPQAKEATVVLHLQGYIEPIGNTEKWRVSEQGDLVSGAKSPRFTSKGVQDALDGLRDRIKAANDDPDAPYRIIDAVAFGDFLSDAARVQAAEVGIRLRPKSDGPTSSARARAAEHAFLKQLRGKTALLHVIPYEDWMSSRSHVRLA
jgi:hypothetical protein